MAPRKRSTSFAEPGTKTTQTPTRATRTPRASPLKPSPTKVTKRTPSPRKRNATASTRDLSDEMTNLDPGPTSSRPIRTIAPLSPSKAGRPPKTSPRKKSIPKAHTVKSMITAQPDPPSFSPVYRPPRNENKPDRAIGESYEILHDGEVIFDARDSFGYHDHYDAMFEKLEAMQDAIITLATDVFGQEIIGDKGAWLRKLDKSLSSNAKLVLYAGFIAVGGPCGVAGWEEIFLTPQLRIALVAGLVWKVIEEHVFESLWFGASAGQARELESLEIKMKGQEDGFMRNRMRAETIRGMWTNGECGDTSQAKTDLACRIFMLIAPLSPNSMRCALDQKSTVQSLLRIVDDAVQMHQCMRLDSIRIYKWHPMMKDYPWKPDDKHIRASTADHWQWLFDPQNRAACTIPDESAQLTQAKVDRIKGYGLLSRVVVFQALEAYQPGGWRPENKNIGQRRKLICKGAVACRWGAIRRFPKEGKTINTSEGEYKELKDCVGALGKTSGGGTPWWSCSPPDPALVSKDVPILGMKGEGKQPSLEGFKPGFWSTI